MLVMGNIDIIMVTESKLDDSSTQQQLSIEGYHLPYQCDRDAMGGYVMISVREDIPCRELNANYIGESIEGLFLEINTRKQKW